VSLRASLRRLGERRDQDSRYTTEGQHHPAGAARGSQTGRGDDVAGAQPGQRCGHHPAVGRSACGERADCVPDRVITVRLSSCGQRPAAAEQHGGGSGRNQHPGRNPIHCLITRLATRGSFRRRPSAPSSHRPRQDRDAVGAGRQTHPCDAVTVPSDPSGSLPRRPRSRSAVLFG